MLSSQCAAFSPPRNFTPSAFLANTVAPGEATCVAVDAGLTLACVATSRNLVLAFSLPSGKLLASCRAHTAGTAVNKVGWHGKLVGNSGDG